MDDARGQNITYWSLITTTMKFNCFGYLIVRPDVRFVVRK